MSNTRRAGFTLIELLIVVVIIGILAAIAIPKFGATRERANQAAVKSDLRNLLTAQETYYGDSGAFATDLASLTNAGLWNPSVGDSVVGLVGTTNSHTAQLQKGGASCSVTYWATPNASSATNNGEIVCN